jgi:hypothetical protein
MKGASAEAQRGKLGEPDVDFARLGFRQQGDDLAALELRQLKNAREGGDPFLLDARARHALGT